METYGVALGYVGDKIRYILIIRVRLTSEFFFRTRIKRIDSDEIKYQYIKIQKYIFLLISAALYFNVFYKYLSNKKLLRILPCQKFHLS